ncbi:ABC-type arginine transport system permease subunit [Variovorax sp. W1I1]|nr:ABC-type arginine transport system permease subunit [Variovorax sp. W1I1]
MIGEASFYGLYLPWLMVLAAGALLALWGVRRLLAATGLYAGCGTRRCSTWRSTCCCSTP